MDIDTVKQQSRIQLVQPICHPQDPVRYKQILTNLKSTKKNCSKIRNLHPSLVHCFSSELENYNSNENCRRNIFGLENDSRRFCSTSDEDTYLNPAFDYQLKLESSEDILLVDIQTALSNIQKIFKKVDVDITAKNDTSFSVLNKFFLLKLILTLLEKLRLPGIESIKQNDLKIQSLKKTSKCNKNNNLLSIGLIKEKFFAEQWVEKKKLYLNKSLVNFDVKKYETLGQFLEFNSYDLKSKENKDSQKLFKKKYNIFKKSLESNTSKNKRIIKELNQQHPLEIHNTMLSLSNKKKKKQPNNQGTNDANKFADSKRSLIKWLKLHQFLNKKSKNRHANTIDLPNFLKFKIITFYKFYNNSIPFRYPINIREKFTKSYKPDASMFELKTNNDYKFLALLNRNSHGKYDSENFFKTLNHQPSSSTNDKNWNKRFSIIKTNFHKLQLDENKCCAVTKISSGNSFKTSNSFVKQKSNCIFLQQTSDTKETKKLFHKPKFLSSFINPIINKNIVPANSKKLNHSNKFLLIARKEFNDALDGKNSKLISKENKKDKWKNIEIESYYAFSKQFTPFSNGGKPDNIALKSNIFFSNKLLSNFSKKDLKCKEKLIVPNRNINQFSSNITLDSNCDEITKQYLTYKVQDLDGKNSNPKVVNENNEKIHELCIEKTGITDTCNLEQQSEKNSNRQKDFKKGFEKLFTATNERNSTLKSIYFSQMPFKSVSSFILKTPKIFEKYYPEIPESPNQTFYPDMKHISYNSNYEQKQDNFSIKNLYYHPLDRSYQSLNSKNSYEDVKNENNMIHEKKSQKMKSEFNAQVDEIELSHDYKNQDLSNNNKQILSKIKYTNNNFSSNDSKEKLESLSSKKKIPLSNMYMKDLENKTIFLNKKIAYLPSASAYFSPECYLKEDQMEPVPVAEKSSKFSFPFEFKKPFYRDTTSSLTPTQSAENVVDNIYCKNISKFKKSFKGRSQEEQREKKKTSYSMKNLDTSQSCVLRQTFISSDNLSLSYSLNALKKSHKAQEKIELFEKKASKTKTEFQPIFSIGQNEASTNDYLNHKMVINANPVEVKYNHFNCTKNKALKNSIVLKSESWHQIADKKIHEFEKDSCLETRIKPLRSKLQLPTEICKQFEASIPSHNAKKIEKKIQRYFQKPSDKLQTYTLDQSRQNSQGTFNILTRSNTMPLLNNEKFTEDNIDVEQAFDYLYNEINFKNDL